MVSHEKVTITLPKELVGEVRRAVKRRGGTVSGYVANAVSVYERSEELRALLDDMDRELGPPSAEERRWAERVLAGDPAVMWRGKAKAASGKKRGAAKKR